MDTYKSKTDEELALLAQVEAAAFGELVKRYEKKIFYYIARLINQYTEAEDVAQDTFIKAYRNIRSFNPKLKFSSWLYRIAHNESVNYIKKNYKGKKVSLEGNEILIRTLASHHNILEGVIEKERKDEVVGGLLNLPLKERNLLELYYFEEKSYLEIADILKVSINSVGPLINRAKNKLKGIIQERRK